MKKICLAIFLVLFIISLGSNGICVSDYIDGGVNKDSMAPLITETITYIKTYDGTVGTPMYFRLIPSATDFYTIETTGTVDTEGELYFSNGNSIEVQDDIVGTNFQIYRQLTAGETYYLRVTNYSMIAGDQTTLRVAGDVSGGLSAAPTITTQAVTDITQTTATGNGNITAPGMPNPTQYGVCWSTLSNPTTADSKTEQGPASATGEFTSTITGLTAGTIYHVRAYATNAVGTSYGDDVTFTTLAGPTLASATYDANTGILAVTGIGMTLGDTIDVSKLTLTGEGGSTYTLTSDNVTASSAANFSVTLNVADIAAVNQIINKNGTSSTGGTPYNLSAAEDWNASAASEFNIADATNAVTASNVAIPTIASATYDANTGDLVVTGTGFLNLNGAANDIDVSKLTLTGEGGATRTLTTTNVEITSGTEFTVMLNGVDMVAVNQIFNKNGTSSTGGSTYNLVAVEDWAAGADSAVVVADMTGNGIVVSNVAIPTITSATYNASTGELVVTGTGLLKWTGADIVANKFALTGEGETTYTLTNTPNVEISSGTSFSILLSTTDKAAVNLILNKTGTSSTGGTTYNLVAVEDWAAGADPATVVADTTGNGITVSNVAVPTITSATYDASTGELTVTGTRLLTRSGASNDIDVSKFTFTGEGGATYTLTDTQNVEISSGTSFTITLSETDKAAVNPILNKNGTSSADGAAYNLAAAEDWAAGAETALVVADPTGKGISVSKVSPKVTITSVAPNPTNSAPFSVTITFTESVSGFEVGDITVTNGSGSSFNGAGTTYTADITPSGQGVVAVNVAAGVADSAGIGNIAAAELSRTYDSIAPDAPTISIPPQTINAGSIIISGTAEAGATITINGGAVPANGTADGSDNYSISVNLTQNAVNTLVVKAVDTAGNESATASVAITEDSTPPSAPNITTGTQTLNTDNITISGTAEAGATITITGGAAPATGTADGSGNYSISVNLAQDAVNTLVVMATDVAGNSSGTANVAITEDSTAPSMPTIAISSDLGTSSTDGVTTTAAQTITVNGEAGASVDLDFGDGVPHATGTIGAGGSFAAPEHTYPSAGKYTISATLTDAVGNMSTAGTKVIVIDTTAPVITSSAALTISTIAATNGATVCALTATDATTIPGFTDTHIWSGGGIDSDKFSIDVSNLKIAQAGGLVEGSYTVQITATDTAGNTNAQTITITVVTGPTVSAVTQSYDDTTSNDTFPNKTGTIWAAANSGSIIGYGITDGITAAAGNEYTYDSVTYNVSKAGTYGTLYVNRSTGEYVYVPTSDALLNSQSATVTDVFTIQATDNAGTTGNSLTITIIGVNDQPRITGTIGDQTVNDNATISLFTNVTIIDVDTPTVTVSITVSDTDLNSAPSRGALSGGSGSYNEITGVYSVSGTPAEVTAAIRAMVFTPTANHVVPGSTETTKFNLRVDDGTWATSTGATSVIATSVNDAPTVSDHNFTTSEDNAINDSLTAYAADIDAGASLTYLLVGGVSNGTLTLDADGTFTYTPTENFNGIDNFTWKANDGITDSGTATANITITAVNDVPTVSNSTKNGTEDTTLAFAVTDFTDCYSDVEGTALYSARVETLPANGTLKLGVGNILAGDVIVAANLGNIIFVPASNFNGYSSFTWKASDGTAYSASAATMTLNIASVDDVPGIDTNNTLTIFEDAAATSIYTYLESSDVDSGSITYTITTAPTKGALTNDGSAIALNGTFTQADIDGGKVMYTPSANLNGADSFVFTVSDDTNSITGQTFNVTITPVNDAPVISTSDTISVVEGTTAAFTAEGSDLEGSAITWSITGGADAVKFSINANTGVVTFVTTPSFGTPTDAGTNNSYVLQVTASDGALTTSKTVTVTVTQAPSDDTPSTPSNNAVVEVNGEKQDAGQSSTETAGGTTTTTITVDDTKLDKILEEKGNNATVTLPAGGTPDVVVGQLTGQTVKNMETKEAVLEIKTETVIYTLPASQINIDAVSSQFGSQVELKDIKVNVKIAEPPADTVKVVEDTASKGNYQIVVKPVEFEITCTSGDTTVEVSRFNGYVERTIAIPDGVDPSKITTGIVLNADGTFSHVPTQIVMINGKYFAKINSLTNSTYSVIYNPVTFTDVTSHWAKDAVNDMGSRMVVTGIGGGIYEPERSITRAEFAAIVVRALGLKKGTTESSFGDVTLTDWFNGYVDTATAYSLITGYSSESFAPNDTITREQAMTILSRAMKLTGLSVTLTDSEVTALLANYTDAGSISDYAKVGAAACIKTGIVSGTTASTLSPKDSVTRAEVAVMVQRLLKKSGLI